MVVPLNFHTFWTRAGAVTAVARLNAQGNNGLTHYGIWDRYYATLLYDPY